ncbi:hypothetical protein WHR41_03893 [Cladosporium halotolerans]|uniref:Uncharacterized protein n=1 Tax=Cladosporium halotolerans TaxID=1052096 RepID=A0AB34KTQ2_9PEZI
MLSLATLSLSLLFSFAAAQSSAITWIEPGVSAAPFAYAGSVVDACPGTTVIALQCTSAGSDNAFTDLCGSDAPSMTMTVGPSQVHFHGSTATSGLDFQMDMTCDIDESSATCTDSTSWSAVGTSTDSAQSSTYAVDAMATHSAEVTAGADKLDNTGKCTASSGSGKGRDGAKDSAAGGRLAVGMGLLGVSSFVGMLLL